MSPHLQDILYTKYPKIFRQKDLSMKETAMCWGIDCGDGWFMLLDNLCNCLQHSTDVNKHPQIEAEQVKEKWGALRFYANGDDFQQGMIQFAEYMSNYICEKCGTTDDVKQCGGSYIQTLCKRCEEPVIKKNVSKCISPDWDESYSDNKHKYDKNGDCIFCGETNPM